MSQIAAFDTSALLKRYVPDEQNAGAVHEICVDSTTDVILSRLVGVEISSALARRVSEGILRPTDRDEAWASFTEHARDEYSIVAVDERVCLQAEQIVRAQRLRSLDALHVASALVVLTQLDERDALTFYTADRRQAEAAGAAGLNVEYLGD